MIQGVISRMAGNAFLLKGWTITLISAVFLLAAKDSSRVFVLIGFLPFLLDFRRLFSSSGEKFRALYEDTAVNQTEAVSFSMKVAPYEEDPRVGKYYSIFFSQTLLVFYAPVLLLLLVLTIVFYRI